MSCSSPNDPQALVIKSKNLWEINKFYHWILCLCIVIGQYIFHFQWKIKFRNNYLILQYHNLFSGEMRPLSYNFLKFWVIQSKKSNFSPLWQESKMHYYSRYNSLRSRIRHRANWKYWFQSDVFSSVGFGQCDIQ